MADKVWAVILTRAGNRAKSRLASALDSAERRALVLAMFSDVVATCVRSNDVLAGTVAVVDAPFACWTAARPGAVVVDDPGLGDMNSAAVAGVCAARRRGATTAIVLPGDIPLVSARDIESLVAAAATYQRAVVIGASRDGQGTNALLLRPPDVILPGFGPPSVDRHVRLAVASGAMVRVARDLGLALDVDTPADLEALYDAPVGPATSAFLASYATRLGSPAGAR
jgi:2-phospho-L-lactate guanylyltransferase